MFEDTDRMVAIFFASFVVDISPMSIRVLDCSREDILVIHTLGL